MRLIDADELIEHAWRDKLDSRELIVEMIERAPTVKSIPTQIPIDVYERLLKQESKWIPVSERLPEESYYCLCCDDDGYITIGWFSKKHGYWIFDDDNFSILVIVAWMPLPEPYKKEESEDNKNDQSNM